MSRFRTAYSKSFALGPDRNTHTRCYHCQMSSVCHCLALPAGEKDLRTIQLEPSVLVPFFHSNTPEVTWEKYSLEALIIHQGPSADSGHYRAAVRAGDEWYLGDDALAPSACALNDSRLTTGSYLLFLKQVRAAQPVIVVE